MEIFINNLTSFPVVFYTFLMAIVFSYWLLAIIGALDIDMFDADIEIEADTDLDMDIESGMDIETDIENNNIGGVTGFMLRWGLTGVPVTVVISVLLTTSWIICYFLASLLLPLIPFAILQTLIATAMIVVSFGLSIPVTAKLIKPLKGAFVTHTAAKKDSFIGCECMVKTGKVNESFGQAEYNDGGAGMLFDIRANAELGLKKGDSVILKSYDEIEDSYWVIKSSEMTE